MPVKMRQLNEKLLASENEADGLNLQVISNPELAENQEFAANPHNVTIAERLKQKRSEKESNSSSLKTIINSLNSTRMSQNQHALRMELARKQAAAQNAAGFRP